jgi:hypothetical protein
LISARTTTAKLEASEGRLERFHSSLQIPVSSLIDERRAAWLDLTAR